MIEIETTGHNRILNSERIIDMQGDCGSYAFLLIKSSANLVVDGEKHSVKEPYMVLSPSASRICEESPEKYCDDWFCFRMNADDVKRFDKAGIRFDAPVYIDQAEEMSNIIIKMSYEHFLKEHFHDDIENHFANILFCKLAGMGSLHSRQYVTPNSIDQSLINLKIMICVDPKSFISVSEAAEALCISRSSLQHNYKKLFGTSIIKDVISSRLAHAKHFLESTDLRIVEISRLCGYKCEYSFMRQFKEKTGHTPSEYRANTAKVMQCIDS